MNKKVLSMFLKSLMFLLFALSCWAYPPQALDMTEYEYRRYVRPQLKSLIQDTYNLLFLLNPEFKEIKSAFGETKKLTRLHHELKDNCPKENIDSCMLNIKDIKEVLKRLSKATNTPVNLKDKKYLNIDEKISAQKNYTVFRNQIIKTFVEVDNILLKSVIKKSPNTYLKTLKHEINLTLNTFYSYITDASDNRFKTEFSSYWTSFVIPVSKHILIDDQSSYFVNNINELNLRWNNLNVRLTKRNKKIPKQVKTLLNIMHNRWNNILKVSLNPQKY